MVAKRRREDDGRVGPWGRRVQLPVPHRHRKKRAEIVEEARLRTAPEALQRRFCGREPVCASPSRPGHPLPVGRPALSEECAQEVSAADARKVRLLSTATSAKPIEIDAEHPARLARASYPPRGVGPAQAPRREHPGAHPALLRSRGEALVAVVETRTRLVESARGGKRQGLRGSPARVLDRGFP
jgi:hypothetical protein